jgi:uncharacterized protein (DUF305 family)
MKKNYISHIIVWVVSLLVGLTIAHTMMISLNHDDMIMDHSAMDMSDPMDHSAMDMSDPMDMSMADMWAMLEGKTWDELDKAFLEGMIPHHQWAIDMAEYLVDAKNPELQEMWLEIIKAQQWEIDQMNEWLDEWGYRK